MFSYPNGRGTWIKGSIIAQKSDGGQALVVMGAGRFKAMEFFLYKNYNLGNSQMEKVRMLAFFLGSSIWNLDKENKSLIQIIFFGRS